MLRNGKKHTHKQREQGILRLGALGMDGRTCVKHRARGFWEIVRNCIARELDSTQFLSCHSMSAAIACNFVTTATSNDTWLTLARSPWSSMIDLSRYAYKFITYGDNPSTSAGMRIHAPPSSPQSAATAHPSA